MTKIDIFSGFLGAGKTTLIKKLLKEAYTSERVVLIENEFGEIGIDGGFLKDAGIEITEMNSGCICCSLVGDFREALRKVLVEFNPDRVIIEPSGVGKLSDVTRAVREVESEDVRVNCLTAVVDAAKCKMYMKNFGEFFNDQIKHATSIILSHTDTAKAHKVEESVQLVREVNPDAVIVTTPIDRLDGKDVLEAMENQNTLAEEIEKLGEEHRHHHHHHHEECGCGHHHHEHDHEECGCGHHHHEHDHEECGCGHHHHEHDHEECGCGHHHHEHDHEECGCGHHHHEHDHEECGCGHHHDHHHADEVFESLGIETAKKFTFERISEILDTFAEDSDYGMVLRAKGIVEAEDGRWIHFDYVPDEPDVREGSAAIIGRICVIGVSLDKDKIKALFGA